MNPKEVDQEPSDSELTRSEQEAQELIKQMEKDFAELRKSLFIEEDDDGY